MKKVLVLLITVVAGGLTNSCKTDFDTLAPYKEMICVYALLEHNSNINYIRINRVFVAEDNAYGYAQNNDSVNFATGELTVTLEKYRDGVWKNSFPLTEVDTVISSGTFTQSQKLWRCNNQLASFSSGIGGTENSNEIKYVLKIHNNKTGKDFSAETKMVKDQQPIFGTLTSSSITLTNPTVPVKLRWYNSQYGKISNCIVQFYYQEFPTNDTTIYSDKMVEWNLGNQVVTDINSTTNEITYSFMGDDFYRALANLIPVDQNIYGRKSRGVKVKLTTCGEEFQLFTEVNSPSNTIVQDKPNYSNITDGVGVFSSRSVKLVGAPTGGYIVLNVPSGSIDKLAGTAAYPNSPTCALKFLSSQGTLGLGCQ